MTGRRRTKTKSLTKIMKDSRRISNRSDELPTDSDSYLPAELLELIFSRLNLKDNIRASIVCKTWLAVATSLRKASNPPWLMFFPKSGDLYEFYNPETRKTYFLELPELRHCNICYAKDGWLLVSSPNTRGVFFLCPYTRELITLPEQELEHQLVAFSAAPTSSSCIVFAVKNTPTVIAIRTCSPGATEWFVGTYQYDPPFICSSWNNIVFCRGRFFCLGLFGWLGIYDPNNMTWGVIAVSRPKCMMNFPFEHWCKRRFMVEHNGDIFVIYTCPELNPSVYKLDDTAREWVEMVDLGGMTFFANSLSSIARSDVQVSNCVYFSKVLFYGKRCVTYSIDNGRYYPREEFYDWGKQDSYRCIWIDSHP